MAQENKIHTFEANGLGIAPFKFDGMVELPSPSLAEHNPTAYNNALAMLPKDVACGTCAYCGHAIKYNYIVKDVNGKRFAVGSECIAKTGDSGLIDRARFEKRKIERAKKESKMQAAAAEHRAKAEAELQAQRKRNNGLTDKEVVEQAAIEARKPLIDLLAPLAERMQDGKGGFRDSIADSLHKGHLPRGRGEDITLDILAKQAGRSGSKAYDAEYTDLVAIFEKARELSAK